MGIREGFVKFRAHMRSQGILYAGYRLIKYFIFLIQGQKYRGEKSKLEDIFVSKDKLKAVFNGCGICLFWKGKEITSGSGLNLAINTLGLWTDSVKANWMVLEKKPHILRLKAICSYLPLSIIWTIDIEDEQTIGLHIDIEASEWLHIDEFRIVCFLNHKYKSYFVNEKLMDFPRQDNNWHDLYLGNENLYLTGVRFTVGEESLPSFMLENGDMKFLSLIQNPPLNNLVHIVGLRYIPKEGEQEYSEGYYRFFNGKIKIFEKDRVLDDKIEDIRLNLLENEIAKKAKNRKTCCKLKVLLANLPWQKDGKWGVRAGSRWPHIKDQTEGGYLPFPFFLAHAAALLNKHNIENTLVDAIAEELPENLFLEKISKMNFDYLVAETSIPSYYYDLYLLKKIAQKGMRIILCGPNSEIYSPQFIKEHPYINFVLYGEYEFTLLELLQALQEEKSLFTIPGIIYNKNGEIRKNLPRSPCNIDSLPWPVREGLPMHKYLDAPGEMLTPCVQMLASRGCPFKCQFCLWPQVIYQGYHYRTRDVLDVVDEMEYLIRDKGFKSVYFDDDTFNIGKERMLSICREIIMRGLNKIQWAIMARPDLMDEEILDNMKKAGLWAVKYGMESADQKLVDNIGKSMNLKKADRMMRYTQQLGIRTHVSFSFGLPGETKETIDKTLRYVKKLNPFSVQFSLTTPFPGTKYYDTLDEKGLIVTKDFSSYDGHYKSVITLDELTSRDLEEAKERAYRVWNDYTDKRRGINGRIRRFYTHTKNRGISYTIDRTLNYINRKSISYFAQLKYYILSESKKYGRSLKKNRVKEDYKNDSRRTGPIDIVLIQSPPWDTTLPPLSIAYLASFLDKRGYKVMVFDLNIALNNLVGDKLKYLWEQQSYDWWVQDDLFNETWAKLKEHTSLIITKKLKDIEVTHIGMSITYPSIHFANEVLNIIRKTKPNAKLILGGWGCINEHMRGLFDKNLVDAFVIGEGEQTLVEVLDQFKNKRIDKITSGAIFNHSLNYGFTPRPPIQDLDSIPWPTFSEFDLKEYQHPILPLFGSRGCVGSCSFCNDWSALRPYRRRSAQNIFDEIKYHIEFNQISSFSFKDLLCNGDMRELNLLCGLIIKSGLKIQWDSQAIPRKEMTYDLLLKLKHAGCSTLIYGVESLCNKTLRAMRKIFTKEIAVQVIRDTHKVGINVMVNIIVGFPGETEDDFQETFNSVRENLKYITQIGAVSVCLANGNADLQLNPHAYDIVVSSDSRISAKHWYSNDGNNTYEIRKARAQKILGLLAEMGIKYATKTI